MSEEYTCIECEHPYDSTDGDTDERMCDRCIDNIYYEAMERESDERVKTTMREVDTFIKSFAK